MSRRRAKGRSVKRGRGRPAILEDAARCQAVSAAIVQALTAGNYLETAAAYAGVAKQSVYNWLRQGARDQMAGQRTVYADFLDAVKKAEADAEVAGITAIAQAARDRTIDIKDKDGKVIETRVVPAAWQAEAWRQERRHPDRWGRRAPGPAPAAPPPPPAGDEVAPETAREKLLKALAGIRERRQARDQEAGAA